MPASAGRPRRTVRHDGGRRRFTTAGLLLGLGLGGFVDGIVLHQILQWHHLLTSYDGGRYAATTVAALEHNMLWDGLFHAGTWVLVAAGLAVLWRAVAAGYRGQARHLVGLLLAGWGVFNLVEGVVDHHLLELHHVRDDVANPLWWDLGFLVLGALLVVVGRWLHRGGRPDVVDLRDPAARQAGRRRAAT